MLNKLGNISKVVIALCLVFLMILHFDQITDILGNVTAHVVGKINESGGVSALLPESSLEKQKKQVEEGELAAYADKWGYNYYKVLDEAAGNYDRTLFYQLIYKACVNYEESVSLDNLKVYQEDAWRIYCSMRLDNPELVQTEPGYKYNYYTDSGLVYEFCPNIKKKTEYNFDKINSECEYAVKQVADIVEGKYGKNASRLQVVKEIHDYIVKKNEYNPSAFDQSMAGLFSSDYSPVCASYALAFKYLCNRFDIQCEIITGEVTSGEQTGPHMWNIVNYGDPVDYSDPYADYHQESWYEVDVTFDDPVGGSKTYVQYDYFNVTTAFMRQSRVRNDLYYLTYPIEECYSADLSYGNCLLNGYFKKTENDK